MRGRRCRRFDEQEGRGLVGGPSRVSWRAEHLRRLCRRCPSQEGPDIGITSMTERTAADIPGFSLSSSGAQVVPGGVFVVGSVGLQAAVEDADEAVRELAQRGLVAGAAGAELLVVGPGSG